MRLLNTSSKLLEYFSTHHPAYAILSHRWRSEEVIMQDLPLPTTMRIKWDGERRVFEEVASQRRQDQDTKVRALSQAQSMKGYAKLSSACDTAKSLGCKYLWMDTCCIDKTSSAELSESLNSMYMWYKKAAICIAYLDDVEGDSLQGSSWFSRGWTLQELIAPSEVLFFSKPWKMIGTKSALAAELTSITNIDESVLLTGEMDQICIAKKMSWAATRETSRVEDEAYCLLGIFGINMPTIYGEGRNAFIRLQEEILKASDDQSIFAWGWVLTAYPSMLVWSIAQITNIDASRVIDRDRPEVKIPDDYQLEKPQMHIGLLASSPAAFEEIEEMATVPLELLAQRLGLESLNGEIVITNRGTRIQLPIEQLDPKGRVSLGYLACHGSNNDKAYAIYLMEIGENRYVRISDYVLPDVLSISLSTIDTSKIKRPEWSYITRNSAKPFAVSILALVNIDSVWEFCDQKGFALAGLGPLDNWFDRPSRETSFDVEDIAPAYMILQNETKKLEILVATTIEPERHSRADKNFFSIKAKVFQNRNDFVAFPDAEHVRGLVKQWEKEESFLQPVSMMNKIGLSDGEALLMFMICDQEPCWTNVDSYNDCRYTLWFKVDKEG